ncbi:putative Metallophosphoesterase domain-containing protein 1 [Hypsibius exemplaris]|uniref:Metallophosphoesterase domain-containing protein 1 n=1 Tax=Hypsibius exemplaris TaxID=2072580 RepID=A0A1W0WA57_HYPEX|nr:putative Metallophosphoesterase domain-containing protein 1 [Hypsibius exemplaris]
MSCQYLTRVNCPFFYVPSFSLRKSRGNWSDLALSSILTTKMADSMQSRTVKTRLLIVSDTHSHAPKKSKTSPFPDPIPRCDVFIHAGDMTNLGKKSELEQVVDWIAKIEAELKIVIAGNHDMELDAAFCRSQGSDRFQREFTPAESLALFTSPSAVAAGIFYLCDETRSLTLSNGATFVVHGSPWQPVFCGWAFNYPHHLDRWNPASPIDTLTTAIPDNVDILVTHGPPLGVFDTVINSGIDVGCPWLKLALERVRPRLHVFGHIHESRGAGRIQWHPREDEMHREKTAALEAELRATAELMDSKDRHRAFDNKVAELFKEHPVEQTLLLLPEPLEKPVLIQCTHLDVTSEAREGKGKGDINGVLRVGQETLVINAAMMSRSMRPINPPFLVDLDLPVSASFVQDVCAEDGTSVKSSSSKDGSCSTI